MIDVFWSPPNNVSRPAHLFIIGLCYAGDPAAVRCQRPYLPRRHSRNGAQIYVPAVTA